MAGTHVNWYAEQQGWPLKNTNIIVEGDLDKAYFELSDRLYQGKTGLRLLGDDLSVFPPGTGDDGGTSGICSQFPVLRKIIDTDVGADGKATCRVVTLLDGDSAGKHAKKILTSKYSRLIEWRDVFVLHRHMPRSTNEPNALKSQIERANQQWCQLDCEIEDLVSADLMDLFFEQAPNCLKCAPFEATGARHYELQIGCKGSLYRFVEENASYEDIELLIDVLRSMRFYVGLNPDGL